MTLERPQRRSARTSTDAELSQHSATPSHLGSIQRAETFPSISLLMLLVQFLEARKVALHHHTHSAIPLHVAQLGPVRDAGNGLELARLEALDL